MKTAVVALLLFAANTGSIPGPTEVVQMAVDQVILVLEDSDLARPSAAQQRRQEIRRIAERLFDFPEMARRSLARHWSGRTPQEREEFVRFFRELIEQSYFGKIENYSHERIVYTGETVDGEFATVRSKILTDRKGEVSVDYRLHLIGSRWAVYDLLIDGVSFVSSYRAQFNRIIQTSSYEVLAEKMRLRSLEAAISDRSPRKP